MSVVTGRTMAGSVVGTPGYMAPEQFGNDPIDHRVDVYASGALLYQMLAGRLAFTGSIGSVMYRTATEEPAPPSSVEGAQRWARFDAVVLRAMARDRDLRFQSADEFRRALLAPDAHPQPTAPAPDDETIVVRSPQPVQSVPTQTTGALAWDDATLSRIESALVAQLGPVARVLVRRAAARCGDVRTLCGFLAEEHLPAGLDRVRFLQAASAGGTSAGGTSAGATVTGATVAGATAVGATVAQGTVRTAPPVSAAAIAHAERVLTRRIGPIARVIVRKAATRSADLAAFHQCLVELAGSSADAGLIGDLQSGAG